MALGSLFLVSGILSPKFTLLQGRNCVQGTCTRLPFQKRGWTRTLHSFHFETSLRSHEENLFSYINSLFKKCTSHAKIQLIYDYNSFRNYFCSVAELLRYDFFLQFFMFNTILHVSHYFESLLVFYIY